MGIKIALFVHDLFLEIGHSNAMIETIRELPEQEIDEIVVVAYTSDNLDKLFPNFSRKTKLIKIPFKNTRPIFVKIILFHLLSFLIATTRLRNHKKISIGIASLVSDVVNIQFIHNHWSEYFFNYIKTPIHIYLYKRLLYIYLNAIERLVYRRKNLRFSVLSNFVRFYLQDNFNISNDRIKTIYSSTNLQKYSISNLSRTELFNNLLKKYPQLKCINPNKPIYLFVGAFQRKGLPIVIRELQKHSSAQLIAIGQSEKGINILIPNNISFCHIKFTKEIDLFYSLADAFVFPTIYEPFGLVITEASMMGLVVMTTEQNVGASEILHDLDSIYIFKNQDTFEILPINILSYQNRVCNRQQRVDKLKEITWKKAGSDFYQLLNDSSN